MASTLRRLPLVLALVFGLGAAAGAADTLLKPLPQPPLGNLPKEKAKELEDARASFDKAKINLVGTGLGQAYAEIGAFYASRGYPDVAEVALYDAVQLAPYDGRWVYLQGVLAMQRKQKPQARNYFEHALELNQFYLPIRASLATLLIENGEVDRARKLLEEYVAKHKDEPKAYAMLGDIALKEKRWADAANAYGEALKLDPNATKLYASLAEAQAGQGNAQAAAASRAKAGDVPPRLDDPLGLSVVPPSEVKSAGGNSAPVPKLDQDPVQQAAFFMSAGQYPAARAQLDKALAAKPDDANVLALYARVEAAAGNKSGAQDRINAALKRAPTSGLVLMTQGVVAETAGDDNAARAAYEKAVNADATQGDARLLLGNLLMRHNQYSAAAEQYRALTRAEPANGESFSRLVAAECAQGKCADALKDINDALRDHPKNGRLVQLFVRLAATCKSAGATERDMAVDYGKRLYAQFPTPENTEALALAAAAVGKWDDAVQLQGAAIFEVVKGGDQNEIALYKQFFQRFQAKQLPDQPWPATHPLFHPEALKPAEKG